jgi:nucleotide-binding universal stress UspA family protein
VSIKSILVHHADDNQAGARLATAIQLARRHDAALTALYVIPSAAYIEAYSLEYAPDLMALYRQNAEKDAKQAETAFGKMIETTGVTADWRCEEGDAALAITRAARHADLTIVAQPPPEGEARAMLNHIHEYVVLAAGRPVLVVPYIGVRDTIGARIVAAWDGSREAARAIGDALPFLTNAETVTLLMIDAGDNPDVAPDDIRRYLARHAVDAELVATPSAGLDVGDVLLSRAADRDADLLVMGAYGHSRLQEFVMGGASRHIFQHMTVPVLMSH